jgi:hypothetical protein
VSGQFHALAALPPGEAAPGTYWIGGSVGPRAGLVNYLPTHPPNKQINIPSDAGSYSAGHESPISTEP